MNTPTLADDWKILGFKIIPSKVGRRKQKVHSLECFAEHYENIETIFSSRPAVRRVSKKDFIMST